jgi:hypothetical protein
LLNVIMSFSYERHPEGRERARVFGSPSRPVLA